MTKPSRTILLIEDSPEDRALMRRVLEADPDYRYELREAVDGAQGLRLWHEQPPDCVLLDYQLPDTDGLALLKTMVAQYKSFTCPVVMLTGLAAPELAVAALKSGAQDFIVKDRMPPEHLHHAINSAIEKVAAQIELAAQRQQLTESEAKFSAAFHKSSACMSIVSEAEVKYVDVNQTSCDLFGVKREDVLGHSPAEFNFYADPAQRLALRELLNRDGYVNNFEVKWKLKTGEVLTHLLNADRIMLNGQPCLFVVSNDITERKRAEETLRDSEERLRIATDAAEMYAWEVDVKTQTIKYADNHARVLGFALPAEMAAMQEIIHPDDRAKSLTTFENALADGKDMESEIRLINPSTGKIVWICTNGIVQTDDAGKPWRVFGVVQNITRRKEAEEKLLENQLFTQSIVDTAPTVLYTFDLKTRTNTYQTSQAAEVLGYSVDELKATPSNFLEHHLHPDDWQEIEKHFRQITQTNSGEVFEFEYRMRHKSGEWRWFRSRDRIFKRDENGKAQEILGIALDVTERKQARDELRESEARFRRILAQSNAGIVQTDATGRMTVVNQRWCEMFGYSEAEMLSMKVTDITHSSSLQMTLDNVGKLAAGGPDFEVEKNYLRKDGSIMPAVSNVSALRGKDGEFQGLVAVVIDMTERLQAEAEIKALSDYNRNVLESITDPFFTLDHDYRFTYMSSQGEKLVWREPGELAGKSLWEEFPGLLGTPFEKMYRDAMEENITATVFGFYPDHDCWYEFTAYPSPNGATVYFKDISQRKRHEMNLAFLAEVSQDLMRLTHIDETMSSLCAKIGEHFKVARVVFAEIGQDETTSVIRHEWRLDGLPTLKEAAELKNLLTSKLASAQRDGDVSYIRDVAAELRDAALTLTALGIASLLGAPLVRDEKLHLYLGILHSEPREWRADEIELIRELTARIRTRLERARAEEDLRISEERFRRLFESAKDGILILSPHTAQIIDTNPYIAELLGFSHTELFGKELWEIGLFKDIEKSKAAVQELQEKKYIRYEDLPLETKTGRRAHVEFISNIYAEGDETVIQCNIRDITERKQSEAERERLLAQEQQARETAEAATRAKDDFLAVISHELRNPLNSILGYARLLRSMWSQSIDLAQFKKAVEVIERSGKAQLELINDLLDTARVINGKLRLEVGRLDLIFLLNDAIEVMRPAADAKNITMTQTYDAGDGQIVGDSQRLQQVIMNLVSNAVKFTHPGGHIHISLRRAGSKVEIQVRDNGKGITAEFLPHIFARFTQADASNSRRHGGLGLGLALVKQLVELHGGTITVESEGDDKGATFTIQLPVQAVAPAPEETQWKLALTEADRQRLAGVSALVIDDEHDARELLKKLLEDYGAAVTIATSAAEGFTLLTDEKAEFSILISDIGMPEEDGYSLIRRVRDWEKSRQQRVPAVALTAFGRTEDRMASIMAGFQMHVPKPVETEELIAVINSLLGRYNQSSS